MPSMRPPNAALSDGKVLDFFSFNEGRARGDGPRGGGVDVLA